MRNKAARKVICDCPLVLIGSPPCTDWSTIMILNWNKMSPQERKERQRTARVHLEFCVKLYRIQTQSGRYFLHEHPNSATSWHEELMRKLCETHGVITTKADQCAYGLATAGPHGLAPAQ